MTATHQDGDGDDAGREKRSDVSRVSAMLKADAAQVAQEGEVDREEDLELGRDRQKVLDALFEGLEVGVEHEALQLHEDRQIELEHRVHLRSASEGGVGVRPI